MNLYKSNGFICFANAAPENIAAAAKPAISAKGTNCAYTLKITNNEAAITTILTASAFSKLINTEEGS